MRFRCRNDSFSSFPLITDIYIHLNESHYLYLQAWILEPRIFNSIFTHFRSPSTASTAFGVQLWLTYSKSGDHRQMALTVSWPFPVHACTNEDVNVSYRVGIDVDSRLFCRETVWIGIVEQSSINGSREWSCRCGNMCGIWRERNTPETAVHVTAWPHVFCQFRICWIFSSRI